MSSETATEGTNSLPPEPPQEAKVHVPNISLDGFPLSQYPTRDDEDGAPESNPGSPFYSHPTTKTSYEQLKIPSTSHLSNYETDVEAASARPSRECTRDAKRTCTKDSMWPQRETLVREAKQRKRKRGCYPWNRLTSRQKLISKILIALLIIGIGVIIGVCVSIAVHGTYFKSQNQQPQVGQMGQ